MKKWRDIVVVVGVVIVSLSVSIYFIREINDNRRITLAINTLRSLYEFETLTQFGENVEIFRSLVTPEVFNVKNVNNSDRILRIFLKFNGNPSYVNVLEATPNFIIYSLLSESIERDRLFIFIYEVEGRRISAIREAELFRFPTTHSWEIDPLLLPPLEFPFFGGE